MQNPKQRLLIKNISKFRYVIIVILLFLNIVGYFIVESRFPVDAGKNIEQKLQENYTLTSREKSENASNMTKKKQQNVDGKVKLSKRMATETPVEIETFLKDDGRKEKMYSKVVIPEIIPFFGNDISFEEIEQIIDENLELAEYDDFERNTLAPVSASDLSEEFKKVIAKIPELEELIEYGEISMPDYAGEPAPHLRPF